LILELLVEKLEEEKKTRKQKKKSDHQEKTSSSRKKKKSKIASVLIPISALKEKGNYSQLILYRL
jgi:hypothetical protein